MVTAFVLDRDLEVAPTQVDLGYERSVLVVDRNLRLGWRIAGPDYEKTQPCFAG